MRFDGRPGNTSAKRLSKFQSNRTVFGAGLAASGLKPSSIVTATAFEDFGTKIVDREK